MWNITSSSVQRAKDELMARRTEFETRYAEEKQTLDAELAVIETLEQAASEFMLRYTRKTAAVEAEAPLPAGPAAGGEAEDGAMVQINSSEGALAEPVLVETAPPPTAENAATAGDVAGLDIVKQGSRWRFYRASLPAEEGQASEAPSSG